ncbi:MAG: glycoside hydrolase family 18 [Alistipes sp.]|nr:glycoside hydrolase family 18 [Alistipes sp.]
MDAGLQADYVRNLKTYKAGTHKVVFASLENPAAGPTRQAERLTALPDSLDFISLNNPDNLAAAYIDEMNAVREKGTKVVYMVDFATFEAEWAEKQKADPSLTEENALAYISEQTEAMLALHDKYRYDGVIFVYGGRSMASMTGEELAQYGGRQTAFFDAVSAWRETHGDAGLSYKGQAQYLLDANKAILTDCDYIMLETSSASNASALTIAANTAVGSGNVPSDRFVITVETTRYDDEDMIYGYFGQVDAAGNAVRSIEGGAVWMGQPSEFTRAGMLILNAQYDYYDNVPTYFHLREAIDIMNPSPKK